MASVVDICNFALDALGKGTIAALDSSTEASRSLLLKYEPTRDAVLRDYPWQFAKKQVALSLQTSTVVGWDYVYGYPSNCVKVRKVYTEETYWNPEPEPFDEYDVGGITCVVCNLEFAYAEYTAKITDPTRFDAMFVKALSFALASEVGFKLTGNAGIRNDMFKLYMQTLQAAQASSNTERYEKAKYAKSYTTGRWA